MLRQSRYNIHVPLADGHGTIVVNGLSGSIDLIDAGIARMIVAGTGPIDNLPAAGIAYLASRGYLTSLDPAAEMGAARDFALRLEAEASSAPVFYLMMTYECQLRCTYCFEHGTRAELRRDGRGGTVITPAVIEAAFAAMDAMGGSACTLYGGEPLQPAHRLVIERVVAEAQRRNFRLMAASNGYDLGSFRDLLGPHAIGALHVPLDGTSVTHDKLRIGPHRGSTFREITENLRDALKRDVRVRVRVNADRPVLDSLEAFADFLHAEGFLRSPLFSCYVKAIFAGRPGQACPPDAITDADIAARLAASPALAQIFSGYPVIHDRVDSLFAGRSQAALRPDHCGASTGRILIFDPMGDIYPCNNVVGQRQHRVGTCKPALTWDDAVQGRWSARTVGRMTGLVDCKYAFFCGGGCLFDAQVQHGSIAAKQCDCDEFAGAFANLVRTSHARIVRSGALEARQA